MDLETVQTISAAIAEQATAPPPPIVVTAVATMEPDLSQPLVATGAFNRDDTTWHVVTVAPGALIEVTAQGGADWYAGQAAGDDPRVSATVYPLATLKAVRYDVQRVYTGEGGTDWQSYGIWSLKFATGTVVLDEARPRGVRDSIRAIVDLVRGHCGV